MGSEKLLTFVLLFAARTCHAWLVRLTRARGVSFQREGNALLYDFWYFSSLKSTIREKLLYVLSRANDVRPYHTISKSRRQPKEKVRYPFRFFFCKNRRKRKSYQKEKRRNEISRSAEHDKGDLPLSQPPFEKGGRKLLLKSAKILL